MRSRTRQALRDLKHDPYKLARLMGHGTDLPEETEEEEDDQAGPVDCQEPECKDS